MRMKFFSAYIKQDAEEPLETVEMVHDGFSLFGFILNFFWLFYLRLWVPAIVVLVLLVSVAYAQEEKMISVVQGDALHIFVSVVVGLFCQDWYAEKLARSGYVVADVVQAKSADKARYFFFQRFLEGAKPS